MNKSSTKLVACLAATGCVGTLAAFTGHAAADSGVTQYYVSTTGTDSAGYGTSSDHAWATIGYAASQVSLGRAGTIVHVAPGTYTALTENDKSGQAGAYLTFISDQRWGAKIVTNSRGTNDFPFRNRGSYAKIIGFDVSELSTGKSPEGAHRARLSPCAAPVEAARPRRSRPLPQGWRRRLFQACRRTASSASVAHLTTWNGSAQRTAVGQRCSTARAIQAAAGWRTA